jgi:hypothetical protein
MTPFAQRAPLCPIISPRCGVYPDLPGIRARGITTGFAGDWMLNDPFEGSAMLNALRLKRDSVAALTTAEALWFATMGRRPDPRRPARPTKGQRSRTRGMGHTPRADRVACQRFSLPCQRRPTRLLSAAPRRRRQPPHRPIGDIGLLRPSEVLSHD